MAGGGVGAALPAFYEFSAPEDWRAIDFISDLHLSPALPLTTKAWAAHLRETPADAVFMLGDLFELWVGDDARSLPFAHECVEVMAEAASRRNLAFMVGNRDFLVGTAMLRDCGLMGLPDPTLLNAWGQRVLLSHGDALCLADTRYQAFRQQVRDARWQSAFLSKPLEERLQIAAEFRRQSQSRRQFDGDGDADIDTATAIGWLHAMGAAEMVHGHTHRPGDEMMAPGFSRHVLTDWDLDGDAPRAGVLRLTRDGFRRLPPDGAS
jgi:UDP-2,3-diacylglucosamine hydrolase